MAQHDSSSGVAPPKAAAPATADLAARGRAAQRRDEQGVRARAAQRPRPRGRIGLTVLALVLVLTGWATLWLGYRARPAPPAPEPLTVVTVPAPPVALDPAARDAELEAARAEAQRRRDLQLITASRLARMQGDPTAALLLLLEVSDRTTPGWWNDMLQVAQLPIREREVRARARGTHLAEFSPDGQRVLVADGDQPPILLTLDNSRPSIELRTEGAAVAYVDAMSFSPDSRHVVVTDDLCDVRIWQVDGETEHRLLHAWHHDQRFAWARFDPTGERVLLADVDGGLWLWSFDSTAQPTLIDRHGRRVDVVAFSPVQQRVLTTAPDGTARLYRTDRSAAPIALAGHVPHNAIVAGEFNPTGTRLLTASHDGTVRIWDAESNRLRAVLRAHGAPIQHAQFSASGNLVVTAASDGTAALWDLDAPKVPTLLYNDLEPLQMALISPNERHILTIDVQGKMSLWDRANLEHPRAVLASQGPIVNARFSDDSQRLTTVLSNGMLHVWHVTPAHPFLLNRSEREASFPALCEVVILFGSTLGKPSPARFVPCEAPDLMERFERRAVRRMAFDRLGQRMVTSSEHGRVQLWDFDTLTSPVTLAAHTLDVTSVALSPDGAYAAMVFEDGSARVVETQPPHATRTLRASSQGVRQVVFSPDNQSMLVVSVDGVVDLRLRTQTQPGTVVAKTDGRSTFSSDGRWIVTRTTATHLSIWDPASVEPTQLDSFYVPWEFPVVWSSPEGPYLIVATHQHDPRIESLDAPRPIAATPSPQAEFESASADGRWLAWRIEPWRPAGYDCAFGRGAMAAILINEDGTSSNPALATQQCDPQLSPSGADTHTIVLVSTSCEHPPIVLRGANTQPSSVRFSPDGRRVAASLAEENELLIWDVARPDAPAVRVPMDWVPQDRFGSRLAHLQFSSDGRHLVAMATDGSTAVIPAHPDVLFRTLRSHTQIHLTGPTRARYAPD